METVCFGLADAAACKTIIASSIVHGLATLLIVTIAGHFLIRHFVLQQKRREQDIELARFIKYRQYDALEKLYQTFQSFMQLYREINEPGIDLDNAEVRRALLVRAAQAETTIDATVLRIAAEFGAQGIGDRQELEALLGHLRQSVQLWRERLRNGQQLPFTGSDQHDYVRFKEGFARLAAYLTAALTRSYEPRKIDPRIASSLMLGAFGNEYEERAAARA